MLITALVSCANAAEDPLENPVDPEQNADSNAAEDTPADSVYDVAFATFPPDTVMIRTKDLGDVTWAEIFVYMRSMVGTLSDYFEDDPVDWSASWDNEISCAEWVLQYAKQEALSMKALEYGAKLHGVALSEDDWAVIREENSSSAADWGGEEKFRKMLWEEKGFKNLELFEYMKSYNRLSELLLMKIFGKELELMTDKDVAEFIADDGFIMAKHIYLVKPEYGGGEDALEKIENILAELNAYRGEDFDAYFDELMNKYSEDTERLDNFPHGFLFQYGDLTQYFYEAASSLEINGLSGIVEGDEGYHIIYRIPLNYDVIPVANFLAEDYRTLRMLVAYEKFGLLLNDWAETLDPEFTAELESIDISEMFKRA